MALGVGASFAWSVHVTASDPKFLARAVPATLRLLAGRDGVGCLSVARWQQFGDWMQTHGLVKHRIPASSVVTASFLPPGCQAAPRG